MCNFCCRINSLTIDKFNQYSFLINILQISISSIIIFINILIFIICDKYLIIRIGFMSYVNNIFLSLLILPTIILIDFYRKRNNLQKEKKGASFILINFILFMSIYKVFSSLIEISKLYHKYKLFKGEKNIYFKLR
jgi:hypothetical protein